MPPLLNRPTSMFQNSLWDLTLFWGAPHHLGCKCLGTWTGASCVLQMKSISDLPKPLSELSQDAVNGHQEIPYYSTATPRQNANEDVNPTGGILLSKCSMIPSKNLNRVMRHGFLLLKLYCLFYNHIFPLIYQLKFLL